MSTPSDGNRSGARGSAVQGFVGTTETFDERALVGHGAGVWPGPRASHSGSKRFRSSQRRLPPQPLPPWRGARSKPAGQEGRLSFCAKPDPGHAALDPRAWRSRGMPRASPPTRREARPQHRVPPASARRTGTNGRRRSGREIHTPDVASRGRYRALWRRLRTLGSLRHRRYGRRHLPDRSRSNRCDKIPCWD